MRNAFTLIELLVVIAVFVLLIGVLLPRIAGPIDAQVLQTDADIAVTKQIHDWRTRTIYLRLKHSRAFVSTN